MLEIRNNSNNQNISRIMKTPSRFQNNSYLNNANNESVSTFRRALPQFLAVAINNVLLTVYGMALGFPITIIPAIQLGRSYRNNDLFLNREQVIWLSSISLTCVPLGSILSGFYSEYIGKKRALQLVNIPIIISFLLYHFATNVEHLYLALGLSAVSCGLIETPVIIFIAETVESKYRSYLTASGSIFMLLGIIFQYYINSILHWRMVAAILTLFPVISIILLFFIPESPIWLIYDNNLVGAIKSLRWFRGWVSENEIEAEFLDIFDTVTKNTIVTETYKGYFLRSCKKNLNILKEKSVWYPFTMILFMFFVSHFSGKTTFRTYTVQIFHTLKAPLKKYEATMLLSLCEILGATFCVLLLQFTGKRKLILVSAIGTSICFIGAGIYSYFLYTIPGYAIDNVVNYAAKTQNENIITINNITDIFNISSENLNVFNQFEEDKDENLIKTSITHIVLDDGINSNSTDTTNIFNKFNHFNTSSGKNNVKTQIKRSDDNKNKTLYETGFAEELIRLTETDKGKIIIPIPRQKTNSFLLIPVILLFGAAFFAHIGLKTIPWILIGEILPQEIRSYVAGIASGFGFFFGFLANYFFLDMLNILSIAGTFCFYATVSIYGAIILYFILPETENRCLKVNNVQTDK